MLLPVHIVIVTHNSEAVLSTCMRHLEHQRSKISSCVIVDNGSHDKGYLQDFHVSFPVRVIETENNGFGRGNNIGYSSLGLESEAIVVFLNPDTYMFRDALEVLQETFQKSEDVGAVTGKLLGYDNRFKEPTGKIDSTGIFRSWFGRWYDRGQGVADNGQYDAEMEVPAICGAFFCSTSSCLNGIGKTVFDEDFFMYKEDIELSLRIRKNGWRLLYNPLIVAYHCRGWENERGKMSYLVRCMSAENEVKLYLKHHSFYMIWALSKYFLVRLFRI